MSCFKEILSNETLEVMIAYLQKNDAFNLRSELKYFIES